MNYNLLEEPWIPVLGHDGTVRRVGIRDALTQAADIRQIAAANPMDRMAIVRFLLALVYWCRGSPPDNRDAIVTDPFPAEWFSKLDDNKDFFNLLGNGKRFFQYRSAAGVRVPQKLAANYLIHEVPTGTNKWHFHHATDKVDGLCPACCAMGLLRLPLFATSAGRGKPPGVNAKPPFYIIPAGASLAAILRRSWLQVSNVGTPAWERPDMKLLKSGEVPLLMGLTWLPRRVWLDNPEEPVANCISCGRKERLIRRCVFAGVGSTKTDDSGPGRLWRDPHAMYTTTRKGNVTSFHARNVLDASTPPRWPWQWVDLVTGFLRAERVNDNVHGWAVGFSTVQNDKYLETVESVVPVPNAVLDGPIAESIEKLDQWQKGGRSLDRAVRPPNKKASSGKLEHVEIRAMLAAIRPHVEAKVSAKVGELLAAGEDSWQQAAREYRPMMDAVAASLSPGFTTAALQRRRQIARATPDMRSKTEPDEKPGPKKGGEQ